MLVSIAAGIIQPSPLRSLATFIAQPDGCLCNAIQAHNNRGRSRSQHGLHEAPRRRADTFYVAAHPSTTEEHTKRSDAARAESLNRDTSDDYLQDETEQNRSRKAKTAFNIVFVTSEVSKLLLMDLLLQTSSFIARLVLANKVC